MPVNAGLKPIKTHKYHYEDWFLLENTIDRMTELKNIGASDFHIVQMLRRTENESPYWCLIYWL